MGTGLKEARKRNTYKMVSKVTLRTICNEVIGSLPAKDPDNLPSAPIGLMEGGLPEWGLTQVSQDSTRSILPIDNPYREKDGIGISVPIIPSCEIIRSERSACPPYRATLPYPTLMTTTASLNTHSPDLKADHETVGGTICGRMPYPRVSSEARVTSGQKGADRRGHHLSVPEPVLLLPTAQDLVLLAEGRRLRSGNRYRNVIVDLRDLASCVPIRRLPHAVAQLARAASQYGRIQFLIHPGDAWVWNDINFPDLHRLRVLHHQQGQIMVLRRSTADKSKAPAVKPMPEPPDVDLAILSAHRDRNDFRSWAVKLKVNNHLESVTTKVLSSNRSIARLEAVAAVLFDKTCSVAIRHDGLASTCLLSPAAPKQVGLHDAIEKLRHWAWVRQGDWIVGQVGLKP